jgi:hypothetical protein
MALDLTGTFLPTTQVWDIIGDEDLSNSQIKELIVRLYQNLNTMALATNNKDTGVYDTVDFVTGSTFFPNPAGSTQINRQVIRKVVNFGALPNTGTKTVAHNITVTAGVTFTRIYGCASDTTGFNYIPLPFASTVLANSVQLSVNNTNVVITTGSNRSNFGTTYVVLEYLLQ